MLLLLGRDDDNTTFYTHKSHTHCPRFHFALISILNLSKSLLIFVLTIMVIYITKIMGRDDDNQSLTTMMVVYE